MVAERLRVFHPHGGGVPAAVRCHGDQHGSQLQLLAEFGSGWNVSVFERELFALLSTGALL